MIGTETLAFSISKTAYELIKAGNATLSSGGVRSLTGQLIELAKPVVSNSLSTRVFGTFPGFSALNIVSSLTSNVQTAILQHSLNATNRSLETVIEKLNIMTKAIDSIGQIRILSWANAALGLANAGISIIGFQKVLQSLNGINGTVTEFYNRYKQDRQNDRIKEYTALVLTQKGHLDFLLQFRRMNFDIQAFNHNEPLIRNDLNLTYAFLKAVANDLMNNSIDGPVGCNILFTLSAIFSQVVNELCSWYWYANHKQHSLFSDWYQIYQEFEEQEFRNAIKNVLAFDVEYAQLSLTNKVDAYRIAFESISEERNLLMTCSDLLQENPELKMGQIEFILNQGIIEILLQDVHNGKEIEEKVLKNIISGNYLTNDVTEKIIVPIAEKVK